MLIESGFFINFFWCRYPIHSAIATLNCVCELPRPDTLVWVQNKILFTKRSHSLSKFIHYHYHNLKPVIIRPGWGGILICFLCYWCLIRSRAFSLCASPRGGLNLLLQKNLNQKVSLSKIRGMGSWTHEFPTPEPCSDGFFSLGWL